MEKKQNRREFFKESCKKVLPIIGCILIPQNLNAFVNVVEKTPNSCNGSCSGLCTTTCSSKCQNNCEGGCKKGVVTIVKKVAKEGVEDTVLVDAEQIAAALVCSHVQIVVRGCVKQVVR